MTVGQLIKELQGLEENYGSDVPVLIFNEDAHEVDLGLVFVAVKDGAAASIHLTDE